MPQQPGPIDRSATIRRPTERTKAPSNPGSDSPRLGMDECRLPKSRPSGHEATAGRRSRAASRSRKHRPGGRSGKIASDSRPPRASTTLGTKRREPASLVGGGAGPRSFSVPAQDPSWLWRSFRLFVSHFLLFGRGEIGKLGALAQLQRADIRGDAPAVFHRHLGGIAPHGAVAIGHYVEEVTGRRLAQPVDVIARGLLEPALHNHS